MSINIKDVAERAGVSVATVSRVINGSDKVREDKREKVIAAMKEMHYSPNLLGRNLRRMETRLILVLISSLTNSFYSDVLHSMAERARAQGYNILTCANNNDYEAEIAYVNIMKNKMADGIVFFTSEQSARELETLGKEYPIIQCSEYKEGANVPVVTVDNRSAAFDMVTHLIDKGRRRIAFLGSGENTNMSARQRLLGYMTALENRGLAFDESLIIQGNYGYQQAVQVTEQFLKEKKVDAIFAISDRMAAGAVRAAETLGLRVPEDLSIGGFDNVDLSYMVKPRLTTVSQSQMTMGNVVADMMIQMIKGEPVQQNIYIPYEILEREST